MLDPLGKNTQRQRFNARHGLFTGRAVNHCSRYLGDPRDPSAIFLLLDLDSESHDRRRSTNGDENSNPCIRRQKTADYTDSTDVVVTALCAVL
jgi:hypothetical protein